MPNAAQELTEAQADVERISRALHETLDLLIWQAEPEFEVTCWEDLPEEAREYVRAAITRLLHSDVIRVGRRPVVETPMRGQITMPDG